MIEPALADDAFLADVESTSEDLSVTFRLWWVGQSGFLVQYRRRHLLFDPYLSDSLTHKYQGTGKPHFRVSKRVVAPERLGFIDVVTSTHNHTDHLDAETLIPLTRAFEARVNQRSGCSMLRPELIVPRANEAFAADRLRAAVPDLVPVDAWDREKVEGFRFTGVPAAHPDLAMDSQGRYLCLGYVVKAGPWTIYHSGDTMVYHGLAASLQPYAIDVAILPINGKVGNMGGRDAARLAKDIGARLVIPCHYDMFAFNTADPNDEFVPECERLGQPYRVLKLGERFSSAELSPRG